jgi:PhzF family phenazine biosynthesis protein
MKLYRIAAFSEGDSGGNPAGVVIADALGDATAMQAIAREIGYSETAFAAPVEGGWRVRYFAPESEVPFCGHATIALGAALAMRNGDGCFQLFLNDASIQVEGHADGRYLAASLRSPPTRSEPANATLVGEARALFGYPAEALDAALPAAIIEAGARHLLLPVDSRTRLASMAYDLAAAREIMGRAGLVTIALVFAENTRLFHARNAFASGGVYEDPATGAAAAALAGYLRDRGWRCGRTIQVVQGEDMGMRSLINVEIPVRAGEGVRVSGNARMLASA